MQQHATIPSKPVQPMRFVVEPEPPRFKAIEIFSLFVCFAVCLFACALATLAPVFFSRPIEIRIELSGAEAVDKMIGDIVLDHEEDEFYARHARSLALSRRFHDLGPP